jgi:uncharacterized protein
VRDARQGFAHEFCWLDLKTSDIAGTAAFFAKVLGWRFAVDENDWRRATKIFIDDQYQIGSVSDLANPIYPPGTPAHIAYYLAVDNVDRRARAAAAQGAQLVLEPSDIGDQGRLATLLDPVGAAVSLWEPRGFSGWTHPPDSAYAPSKMILACADPDRARRFYQQTLGASTRGLDFVTAGETDELVGQWELVVEVDDLHSVAARAREHGQGCVTWAQSTSGPSLRLSSPEGHGVRLHSRN